MVEIIDKAFCTNCVKLRKYNEKGNCIVCGENIFEKRITSSSYIGISKEDAKSIEGEGNFDGDTGED